jgi:hypothetical protein
LTSALAPSPEFLKLGGKEIGMWVLRGHAKVIIERARWSVSAMGALRTTVTHHGHG